MVGESTDKLFDLLLDLVLIDVINEMKAEEAAGNG